MRNLVEFNCSSESREITNSDLNSSLKTEWLSSEQTAEYLKISVKSLRNMTSSGNIPYYKLGNRNRYLLSELREFLLRNRRGGFHGL